MSQKQHLRSSDQLHEEEASKLVYIVAGEASGDILGAGLMKALSKKFPKVIFRGIGGPLMSAQGLESFYPYDRLAVMGIVPILSRYFELLAMRKRLREKVIKDKTDCFIGIDAPVFNTELEYQLTKKGITCAHYVSPSVWAWREKRIHKIVKSVSLMLCLFPFELEIYNKHKLAAVNVGHPLADDIPIEVNMNAARDELGIDKSAKVLAILPGSRGSETKFLLAPFIAAAERLSEKIPSLQFILPCANGNRRKQIERYFSEHPAGILIRLVDGKSRVVMQASDWVLLASGTATLEAMLLKKPMVVAYKVSKFSYFVYSKLLKIKSFSLPNLLSGTNLVAECIQENCTPANLTNALNELISSNKTDNHLIDEYTRLHKDLRQGGSEKAATAVYELMTGELGHS